MAIWSYESFIILLSLYGSYDYYAINNELLDAIKYRFFISNTFWIPIFILHVVSFPWINYYTQYRLDTCNFDSLFISQPFIIVDFELFFIFRCLSSYYSCPSLWSSSSICFQDNYLINCLSCECSLYFFSCKAIIKYKNPLTLGGLQSFEKPTFLTLGFFSYSVKKVIWQPP